MDIKDIISPLRKWWWMIISAAFVAAVASFVATLRQVPNYQSHTTLMIGQTITDPNPSLTEFSLGQQLAASYADMAMREPVRNATMSALGLTFIPDYTAQALPNSQVIEIAVTDTNPARAQSVAKELLTNLSCVLPRAIIQKQSSGWLSSNLSSTSFKPKLTIHQWKSIIYRVNWAV